MTWVVVPMTLRHEAFDLDVQDRLVTAVDNAVDQIARSLPGVKVLRARRRLLRRPGRAHGDRRDATILAIIETIGTVLLIVGVFRRLSPLLLNLLALVVGIAVAFAGTFLVFGEIHVAALLFGTSLIGVAVDYGLHYCTTAFGTSAVTGQQRLAYVLPAITLGLITTLIGYSALAIAPFPGLKQIAVFALIGLIGAFATVALWFPLLDRLAPLQHGASLLRLAALPWVFWTAERHRIGRAALVACCLATLGLGLARYHVDDDVRRLQALSPTLLREQDEIRRLVGATTESQHVLVVAADDETALQREEALIPILDRLVAEHAIAGYQMLAAFVPSLARQSANRAMVKDGLVGPLLAQHVAQLGLTATPATDAPAAELTVSGARAAGAVPLLSDLVVAPGLHIVALQGLTRPDLVRAAVAGQPDVRFVDPTADFSRLLGAYRSRAIVLTVISVVLVSLLLAWRYGAARRVLDHSATDHGGAARSGGDLAGRRALHLLPRHGAGSCRRHRRRLHDLLRRDASGPSFGHHAGNSSRDHHDAAVVRPARHQQHPRGACIRLHPADRHHRRLSLRSARRARGHTGAVQMIARTCRGRSLAGVLAILATAACTAAPPETASSAVPAASAFLAQLRPHDLGREFEAVQLVTVSRDDKVFVAEVRLSVKADRLMLVAQDTLGQRLMTIVWTDTGITDERSPNLPALVSPKGMLADLVAIGASEAAVRRALQQRRSPAGRAGQSSASSCRATRRPCAPSWAGHPEHPGPAG